MKPERYNEQVWLSDEEDEEDVDGWVLNGSSAEEEDVDLESLVVCDHESEVETSENST